MRHFFHGLSIGIFVVLVGWLAPSAVLAVDCTRSAGGNVTISSSCTFPLSVDGADAGTGTSNTAVVTVGSGATLTVSAGQTVAAGSLDMTSTGSVAIVATGQIKPGSPLWMYDADADGYPKESTMAAQAAAEPGWRRRNLMTSMTQRDCQDFYNSGYGCVPATNDLTNGTHSGAYQESAGNPAQGYRELPADNSTVGLWHMNEASGTSVADSSGNSNTGTATGTTVVAGRLGNARNFNGTSDYVSVTNESNFDFERTNTFSIEAWIKTDAACGPGCAIFSKLQTGAIRPGYELNTSDGNKLNFHLINNLSTNNRVSVNRTITLNDGNWHHVAATYDGSSTAAGIKLYVDGKDGSITTDQDSLSATILTDITPNIGSRNSGADAKFNGQIDEVRISNIARTPEEIKADAQRRPYAVYTAPVNDLGQTPGSWSGMTVKGKGIRTGDGETPHSTNSLVAQWNFNESAGTTAVSGGTCGASCKSAGTTAVSGGTCGASCNGTLTNFANTTAYDAVAGTGWTAANRRWGAGALMFDGTNDYITVPNQASLNGLTTLTIESELIASPWTGYQLGLNLITATAADAGKLGFSFQDPTVGVRRQTINSFNDGNWHYGVATYDGSKTRNGMSIYVDGILNGVLLGSSAASGTINTDTSSLYIGDDRGLGRYFNGTIDSTRIYSRALSAAEILANYQAGNIELQTRTSADNSTWEAWKPTTSETALDAVDSLSPVEKISQTSLTAYWKLDETSGTRADSKGSNTLTDNNTVTYAPGRLSNAGQFTAANSEYLSIVDNADLGISGTQNFTIAAWVYLDSDTGATMTIATKMNSSNNKGYQLYYQAEGTVDRFQFTVGNGTIANDVVANNFGAASTGTWYFVVAWRDGTNTFISVNNGTANSGTDLSISNDATTQFRIGSRADLAARFWDGRIDEVAFWKRTLTAAERTQLFEDGLDLHGAGSGRVYRTRDTTTKIEGVSSEKLVVGSPQVDSSTVGLWHMDETSNGNGDVKDTSSNVNHLTPKSTPPITDGFFGKSRDFDGIADYLCSDTNADGICDDDDGLDYPGSGSWSVSAWVKLDGSGNNQRWTAVTKVNGANDTGYELYLSTDASGNARYWFGVGDGAGYDAVYESTYNSISRYQSWHHVVGVKDGTTLRLYFNGEQVNTFSPANKTNIGSTVPFAVGARDAGVFFFDGKIDEVRISNTARSAEEIAEAYRAGRDHRLTKSVSSVDLSAKSKLPFYIAADRPGTYLETTIGESAYANYEPDTNTVGLWHLEEQTGSGAYIKDYSGRSNNGTPTGTTFVQGKLGKARSFNGSSDYVLVANENNFDFEYTQTTSVEFWAKIPSTITAIQFITSKFTETGAARGWETRFWQYDAGEYNFIYYLDGTTDGQWQAAYTDKNINDFAGDGLFHHFVATYDGSGLATGVNFYIDGQVVTRKTSAGTPITSSILNDTSLYIGTYSNSPASYFKGTLDEVRISNTARTADEIRQAYEVGKRTHPVTIDFVTSPQAAYSSGTSVTINNPYGTTALTNTLSVGDTIIFKENVGGTETVSQAVVSAIANTSSVYGTVTLSSAPSFPSGGYTTNAKVFKWQREYFDLTGSLSTHRDAVTRLTWRVTDGSQGANVWLDDIRSASYINRTTCDTLNTATGECTYTIPAGSVTSTLNRYAQIRAIMSTWDTAVSPIFTSSQIEYGL